mmetsp:Transcript_61953/g.85166  ORF Transcript_61953/g.85166 Transcript_61953/m.85166 type:complete len:223 (-) Transcript_61953:69-737(-)|eukprot:CAMPEP_0185793814 /NCGR_PEP_ID=MMETSP1174-20130828/159677_1 /TAXON_ID=35687 /ORGANISM="Dictyocha speculum, Strain CCMP1381" /LENGTH=222 /DNA_ID=CAMNT_0028488997 /DNA_START=717 /DNA_END=1385 /DNA_ORIENTATION=+
MISVGVGTIKKFRLLGPAFGGILVVSAYNLLRGHEEDLSENGVLKMVRKGGHPAVDYFDGDRFLTKVEGATRATPLLLCVACIELSDFVFAVDSIPAVLSISKDPVIVFSSNIFAIMGLRSLYSLVAKAISELPFLRPSVALILGFVGLKMVAEFCHFTISTGASLTVITMLLGLGVALSLLIPQDDPPFPSPYDSPYTTGGHSVDSSPSAHPSSHTAESSQ